MTEYRERRYRQQIHHKRLVSFKVAVQETDLMILAESDLTELTEEIIYKVRIECCGVPMLLKPVRTLRNG